jgi:hypothetical protein
MMKRTKTWRLVYIGDTVAGAHHPSMKIACATRMRVHPEVTCPRFFATLRMTEAIRALVIILEGVLLAAVGLASLTGCARGRPVAATAVPPRTVAQVETPDGDWYRPALGTTWQWQLQGSLNLEYEVDLYDIDLFVLEAEIDALHAAGRRVICYFSAGSYEPWRPDAYGFGTEGVGRSLAGWPDERWLDVRAEEVRRVMAARLDLARAKGCDGVEPDNVDGYLHRTGFGLTVEDQMAYNRWLAAQAHARGLAVGLKNALDLVPALVDAFDFAVNEACHAYDECEALRPFLDAGKPVFNAEYADRYVRVADAREALCAEARALGVKTLVLPAALDDGFRFACE